MPEIPVSVRGRQYDIACTDDEHEATVTARDMLNHEMQKWVNQEDIGIPHLLIMCALSFADQIRNLERQTEEAKDQLDALRSRCNWMLCATRPDSAESKPDATVQEFEDKEIPDEDYANLTDLADFAEEIATGLEESFGISSDGESDRSPDSDN